MKHVDELAIIGILLKAVKTSWVYIMQLTMHRLFSLAFVAHTFKIAGW